MSKNYKKGQHIHKFLPCPSYEISRLENWFSDLAEEGLQLTQDGIFAGAATFEYTGPQKVRYRLEAAEKNTSMWADNNGEPDPEQIEFSEKYSWEYIARLKNFYLYRSTDPSARELNTDPEVQALALNAVKKRQRDAVISSVILFILYPIILTRGCLLMTAIAMGTWWSFLLLLFAIWMIAADIKAFVHLKKVQKALAEEGGFQEPDKKKSAVPYVGKKIAVVLLGIVLLGALLRSWGISITNENKIALEDYAGEIPFATIRDFAGEGSSNYEVTMTGLRMGFNTVEVKTDLLAPIWMDYNEHARVQKADGSFVNGGLYVEYCELMNSTLAEVFVREMYRLDRVKRQAERIEAPALDADEVIAYTDDVHFPNVIIRKGNVVIKASFYQVSESYTMPVEEWSEIICGSIKDKTGPYKS